LIEPLTVTSSLKLPAITTAASGELASHASHVEIQAIDVFFSSGQKRRLR
jgi:hypothetical protein